jgi:HAD superfamily hydrolase (TIGR01509 family)
VTLPVLAVTFDFGQTLCELDTGLLSRRLAERGLAVAEPRLDAAVIDAWRAYDAAIDQGLGGHPWKILMRELLARAGAPEASIGEAVDWLWTEQPLKNLWRRPIEGMIEIVIDLHRAGIAVGVVSNSEGKLAELIDEIGWGAHFPVVADSGKLGLEKPGPAIFQWAAERLGALAGQVVHVGDSLAADVEGALGAGMRAVYFKPRARRPAPVGVKIASDAAGLRRALGEWGIAVGGGTLLRA